MPLKILWIFEVSEAHSLQIQFYETLLRVGAVRVNSEVKYGDLC